MRGVTSLHKNDIAAIQRLGAFHAASAMECMSKGSSAHLRMAVWHQNHAAYFYGSARSILTKVINFHITIEYGER